MTYNCVFCLFRVLYWTEYIGFSSGIYRSSVVNPVREAIVTANITMPDALAIDFAGTCSTGISVALCIRSFVLILLYTVCTYRKFFVTSTCRPIFKRNFWLKCKMFHSVIITRNLCHPRYDRVMRPTYKLLHPNFVHANHVYFHYRARI